MAKSKLELILELKNKLFNQKLKATKNAYIKSTQKMKQSVNKLKMNHVMAFKAMTSEFPVLGRAADLLTNKYVLMAAAVAGIGLTLFSATKKAADFNHEFLQIKQLNLDKSKAQLDSYKKTIKDTAFEAGTDLNKTTQAFYDVQSATGLFGDSARKVVSSVAKFSVATGADLNDSINATTKAMKAFGLSANDVEKYLESNAKTVQVGITTFKELAQVQTEYAGAAAGAGQSVDTANKVFAAFTSIAKDSRTAATMTKTAFLGLTQKQTIKGLKEIGIDMYDANGQMRNLGDVLQEVSAKFKEMTPQQIDELINKIGGPEGLRNLFIKLKTGADDFFKTMDAYDSSKFNLDQALKNAHGDFNILSDMLKNRFNVLMVNLGEKILPMVITAFHYINEAVNWAYNNWGTIQPILEGLTIAFVALKGSVMLSSFSFKTLFTSIKTGIYGIPLIGWILAIIGLIIELVRHTEGWKAQWENLKQTFALMWEGIKLKWDLFTHGMYSAWMWLQDGIVKGWKWAQNMIGKLSDEQYKKDIAQINAAAEERKRIAKQLVTDVINNEKAIIKTAKWKLKWKSSDNADQKSQAVTDAEKFTSGIPQGSPDALGAATGNSNAANDVTKVAGAGQQVRSINITIDSFIKGEKNGVVFEQGNTELSLEQLEQQLGEIFTRMIRNAEMMGG